LSIRDKLCVSTMAHPGAKRSAAETGANRDRLCWRQMAAERGMSYAPSQLGEYVSGSLKGSVNLASGRMQ
jgi:hypothetical protein